MIKIFSVNYEIKPCKSGDHTTGFFVQTDKKEPIGSFEVKPAASYSRELIESGIIDLLVKTGKIDEPEIMMAALNAFICDDTVEYSRLKRQIRIYNKLKKEYK